MRIGIHKNLVMFPCTISVVRGGAKREDSTLIMRVISYFWTYPTDDRRTSTLQKDRWAGQHWRSNNALCSLHYVRRALKITVTKGNTFRCTLLRLS